MSKLIKYSKYESVLKEVYRLAKSRSLSEGIDPVSEYLNTLDFDTVKIVEAVMYIGRDYVYPKKEELERDFELLAEGFQPIPKSNKPVKNPDALIDEYLEILGNWDSKANEINQIASKGPLDNYLEKSFKYLGLK